MSDTDTITIIQGQESQSIIEETTVELTEIQAQEQNRLTIVEGQDKETLIESKAVEVIEIQVPGQLPAPLKNPVFTYTGEQLTSILYDDGSTKVLTYLSGGQLDTLTFTRNGVTILKQFNYDSEQKLINIVQTQV
jgi:hypothetical protein